MDDFQRYIHLSRYARWLDTSQRRESWGETVGRYFDFWSDRLALDIDLGEAMDAVLGMEVMPSMRCLMTAGPALERDHVAGYNCAYTVCDHPRAFDETLYVLMCGTGVGFSVERDYVKRLPEVPEDFHDTTTTVSVTDSKIGWAKSLRELLGLLWTGQVPKWDVSAVRPAGARLKTFGGRASGPEPLEKLFEGCVETFIKAAGRQLTSIECHDIMCRIADAVVVGGVRRSAMISLSNLDDSYMRRAKTGAWYQDTPHRALANNSVAYTTKPDVGIFLEEWQNLVESKTGERGIFSRMAARETVARTNRRDEQHDFGTNPCSEIILRPRQFCNLSEVICREGDSLSELKRKVRIATFLGTMQSTLTEFRYLRKSWRDNCEEERLLGVSLTGIMDHNELALPNVNWLDELRHEAITANIKYASALGINPSAAITCVKPSGTVSSLCGTSSGIHSRYADYYIRRVISDRKDPLAAFLYNEGVPTTPHPNKPEDQVVFEFPMISPRHANRNESAIKQLERWKKYSLHWCEHKPSMTVYYKEEEAIDVAAWVYRNFDLCSGISFFPHTDHVYQAAPFEQITKSEYENRLKEFPKIDWDGLKDYETEDQTTSSQEYACSASGCEVV